MLNRVDFLVQAAAHLLIRQWLDDNVVRIVQPNLND